MSDELMPRPAPLEHGAGPLGKLAHLAALIYGDAERDRVTEPVRHLHDSLENEIDEQLRSIQVETHTAGWHYGVRIVAPQEPDPPGPVPSYRYYPGPPTQPPEALQA